MQVLESDEALGPLATDIAATALRLARRFAAGATMWCWAPDAGEHAHHVAVEFVHPVIVGKRALPAVAVSGPDVVDTLRTLVQAGDIVIVVGPEAGDPRMAPLLRRATSWGMTTVWIGAGERPAPGAADCVLWAGGDAALAPHDGRFVLVYHLLWELTHVCFEHPGLLQAAPDREGPSCTTCSDEGRLAEVVDVAAAGATVRTATGIEQVDTTLVGDVGPGDVVLVHAGSVLTVVEAS